MSHCNWLDFNKLLYVWLYNVHRHDFYFRNRFALHFFLEYFAIFYNKIRIERYCQSSKNQIFFSYALSSILLLFFRLPTHYKCLSVMHSPPVDRIISFSNLWSYFFQSYEILSFYRQVHKHSSHTPIDASYIYYKY